MEKKFFAEYCSKIKYLDDNMQSTILLSDLLGIEKFNNQSVHSVLWTDKNDKPVKLGIKIAAIEREFNVNAHQFIVYLELTAVYNL